MKNQKFYFILFSIFVIIFVFPLIFALSAVYGKDTVTQYNIYRNGAFITSVPATQLYYNDTNVVNGQTYTYYVTAVNSVGENEKSNEVQATPGSEVPEIQIFWLPIIGIILLIGILRKRRKTFK